MRRHRSGAGTATTYRLRRTRRRSRVAGEDIRDGARPLAGQSSERRPGFGLRADHRVARGRVGHRLNGAAVRPRAAGLAARRRLHLRPAIEHGGDCSPRKYNFIWQDADSVMRSVRVRSVFRSIAETFCINLLTTNRDRDTSHLILAHEGRLLEAILKVERGVASRDCGS
jgi:hypothetical protein